MPKHLLSDFFKVLYIFIKIPLGCAPAKFAANHKNPGNFLSSFHFFAIWGELSPQVLKRTPNIRKESQQAASDCPYA
tara:strand:+ start:76 stop:306 length:231 start_codon:yes stop_codon:yes gene_type:complete